MFVCFSSKKAMLIPSPLLSRPMFSQGLLSILTAGEDTQDSMMLGMTTGQSTILMKIIALSLKRVSTHKEYRQLGDPSRTFFEVVQDTMMMISLKSCLNT